MITLTEELVSSGVLERVDATGDGSFTQHEKGVATATATAALGQYRLAPDQLLHHYDELRQKIIEIFP